jgi:hypothetical protein
MTLRYPVEIRRAAEIDDRVAREVIQQVEIDPKPALTTGGADNAEAAAESRAPAKRSR